VEWGERRVEVIELSEFKAPFGAQRRKKINRFALIPLLPSLRSVGRNDKNEGSADISKLRATGGVRGIGDDARVDCM